MISKLSSTSALLITAGLLTFSSASFAADGKELYTAKGCVACHGADAKTPMTAMYPKVAGQNKEYLTQQMKDIKSGARSNGQSMVMKGIMAAVSDEEIEALSEYLSGLE
ncbi:cytochrome c [uncultured Cocleimonas sp.]|uniref:c-type cytochrome n=1 Tax=uncultured Cocleimonas sp. TaxID=1051587 RepID=UPI002626DE4C|nr:cytochrome c [uncultured Cocleimonas sp.]